MELKLFNAYAALVNVAADLLCAEIAYETARATFSYGASPAAVAVRKAAQDSKQERLAAADRLPEVIKELSRLLEDHPADPGAASVYFRYAAQTAHTCASGRSDHHYRKLAQDVRALLRAASLFIGACEGEVGQRLDVTV